VQILALPDSRADTVRISEVLAALSFALDLADGQPAGHSLRTTLIGIELADRLGFSLRERIDLYYALMLKDVASSSTSARVFELFGGDDRVAQRRLLRFDWSGYFKALRFHLAYSDPGEIWSERLRRAIRLARSGSGLVSGLVDERSRRGADIVRRLGFNDQVAEAVASADERWDGSGRPKGLRGSVIPAASRVLALAQMIEAHATVKGPLRALEAARRLKGRWFDPVLVEAGQDIEPQLVRWCALDEASLRHEVRESEPGEAAMLAGPGSLDCIAQGFAEVVDAKSPYTAEHSSRVSEYALRVADRLGFQTDDLAELKRAALLHDIGKLSVPNSILNKSGPLNAEEWEAVRLHPYYTQRILEHIRGFERLAVVAALHHERLDGRGYFHGFRSEQIPLASQIIATADIYDALTTARPYQEKRPPEEAVERMRELVGTAIDPTIHDALEAVVSRRQALVFLDDPQR
jgi:HD-GYP domain-containing protein (c-di-GMP phosphodiesterase class II)